MGNLKGKVALVTGAARGQGRSHVVRLANEGADIVAVDICSQIASVPYKMSSDTDLEGTVSAVRTIGQRISAHRADVRDRVGLQAVVDAAVADLGPIDIVVANAGIGTMGTKAHRDAWMDVLAVNLTGVYNTVEVAIPSMIAQGSGGSVIITGSAAGLTGVCGPDAGSLAYAAAKHGVVGLMRCYANILGEQRIRVNLIAPTGVNTPMVVNEEFEKYLAESDGLGRANPHALPISLIEPCDVSNAVAWLASDESRYVTGIVLPVDAGFTNKK